MCIDILVKISSERAASVLFLLFLEILLENKILRTSRNHERNEISMNISIDVKPDIKIFSLQILSTLILLISVLVIGYLILKYIKSRR